jgi:hypothetical protein
VNQSIEQARPACTDPGMVARNLVTVPEAARRAQVSPRTIWGLIRAGIIPAWGTPKCYRVSMDYILPRVEPTAVRRR